MSGLAEAELDQGAGGLWLRRVGLGLVVLAIVGGLVWIVRGLASGVDAPKRQVATIRIVPDTPPPPPPPKKEEDKPPEPPKQQPKEIKLEQPKPAEAPKQQAEQLKMEGPASDAPGGIAAGTVTQDYSGQPVTLGPSGGGGFGSGIGRAAFAAYQLELQALIQERLATLKQLKQKDYRTPALVRLDEQQRVLGVSLVASTGSDEIDRLILDEIRKVLATRPPPASTPYQDFTIRISNRMLN
jgi:periplasmic protein TonB